MEIKQFSLSLTHTLPIAGFSSKAIQFKLNAKIDFITSRLSQNQYISRLHYIGVYTLCMHVCMRYCESFQQIKRSEWMVRACSQG